MLAEQLAEPSRQRRSNKPGDGLDPPPLDETAKRRKRLVRNLEFIDDPDGEPACDVGIRLSELRVEAEELTAALREPGGVTGPDPNGRSGTGALFDALRLEITYEGRRAAGGDHAAIWFVPRR